MADENPILVNGNGTPYLAIFNGSDKPIMDALNGIPIGMELDDFKYKYTEGKGDSGSFTISTDYINIVDEPDLRPAMPLKIQWGWIFSDGSFLSSPVRLVHIKERRVEFNENGVKFTIEYSDAKMFLEMSPSKYIGSKTTYLEALKELLMGRFMFKLVDFSTKETRTEVELRNNSENGQKQQNK